VFAHPSVEGVSGKALTEHRFVQGLSSTSVTLEPTRRSGSSRRSSRSRSRLTALRTMTSCRTAGSYR
jgi:hypothetical protein